MVELPLMVLPLPVTVGESELDSLRLKVPPSSSPLWVRVSDDRWR